MSPEIIDKIIIAISIAYPATKPSSKADFVKILSSVPDTQYEILLQTLKLTPPGYAIGVGDIRSALAKIEPHSDVFCFQTMKWLCQACNHQFFYNYSPASGAEYVGVFSFCPECGFSPQVNLCIEGSSIFYTGNQGKIEALKIPRASGKSIIDLYKNRTGFWNEKKEKESEEFMKENLYERRGYR